MFGFLADFDQKSESVIQRKLFSEFDDFHVLKILAVDGEADEGAAVVPALQTGCAGINVEALERAVVEDFEDVGVSGDEEVGRAHKELSANAAVVVSGVAADVFHQDVCVFATKAQGGGVEASQVSSVAVAADGAQGFEAGKPLGEFECADVAGVPYLVAFGKMLGVALVPVSVGVGEESDAFHRASERWSFWQTKSAMRSAVCSMPRTDELMQRW